MSWLGTTDHKRIAILYALSITVFFFIGGVAIGTGAARTDQSHRPVPYLRRIPSPVHHARHHHGVVLPGAVDPGDHGQFHFAADDRRARRGVSAAQPDVLVSLCRRRGIHRLCAALRRRRYRMDVLSAVFVGIFALQRDRRRSRRFRRRLFLDRDRRQLPRHDPHAARTRHDLVSAAAVRLVDVHRRAW